MNLLNFQRNFDKRLEDKLGDALEALAEIPTEDQEDGETVFLDTTGDKPVFKVSGIE